MKYDPIFPLPKDFRVPTPLVKIAILLIISVPLILITSMIIGFKGLDGFVLIIVFVAAALIGMLILQKPYWGLILITIWMPIEAILSHIPFGSFAFSLLGIITIVGYLFLRKDSDHSLPVRPQIFLASLFVLWIIFSNPSAALFPEQGRIFAITYIQLLILAYLAAQLLTPNRQKLLMVTFIITSILSAIIAIPAAVFEETRSQSVGSAALMGNENGLALFLNIAFLFTIYLAIEHHSKRWVRILTPFTLLILSLGTAATLSRSGFISLGITLLLLLFLGNRIDPHNLVQLRKMIIIIIVLIILFKPINYWESMISSLPPIEIFTSSEVEFRDPRTALWESAFRAWNSARFLGVGVGRFKSVNALFIDYSYIDKSTSGAHNTFLGVLAENGLIGFIIFMSWLATVFMDLWSASKKSKKSNLASLVTIWWIILFQICIFGVTHSLQYFKLLWMIAGISSILYIYADRAGNQA